ncbi:MAG: hypothetical protein HY766_04465 [candidate division NC10 bacterium]|nr:hypothetical protein [candidate division NC10 bacterium]
MPDPSELTNHVSRITGSQSPLLRLTRDLDRWGSLFLEIARTKEIPAVEQILGGLVEWMGSDLLDGWLRLPIPLFEEVSDLSEELFRACEAYLAWIRQARHPIPAEARRPHEEVIRGVLQRVHALAERPIGG